ncbi:glycoside hydrolase family 36 protein [Hypoxylon sp. CI-4A]|nr:glycoside hydrolase family 36 protein [Hypoxylon sp. CI-4A]
MMEITIASFPPLGQVTQLKKQQFEFELTALLEVGHDYAKDPWEVAVWCSSIEGVWVEKLLSPKSENLPSTLQVANHSTAHLYFSASFFVSSLMNFTIKFRNGPDEPWRWSRDVSGTTDGVVLLHPASTLHEADGDLYDIIHGLNPDLTVKSAMSQTPRTQLWTIEANVNRAENDRSTYAEPELGNPWGGAVLRYFALVRHASPWLGPRHGNGQFSLDKDAVLCSFMSRHGRHLVLLGVSRIGNITTLRSSDSGSVKLHIRNESQSSGLVLAAVGDDFESTVAAVMYHARTVVFAAGNESDELIQELQTLDDEVEPQWYENWYDGLGYCTWNALGQQLTDEKLIDAVESLAKNNVNISSLIIDDNWQDIDYQHENQYQRGWKGFEAEPKAFPRGFKDTISRIRSKHPKIEFIAVWHALLGYWGGISNDGELAKTYRTVHVDRDDSNLQSPMTVIAKEDVGKFYDDFYRFLADSGIDGVKTDVQYMVDTWISSEHRKELTQTYLDSWMISALRHFSIRAISCMSQAPQLLFHQQLPRNRPPMLVRNSDDFYPDIPDSHPWHLFANAHNTLLTQHLNILPDWDMFQTDHEFAGFHAAARCLSGGPIYITDVPGKHNIDIINQITGRTPRGKTVIFRPSVLGRTINPYSGYNEPAILKIGSYHGRASTGTPFLGVFNISQRSLSEIIPIADFPGIVSSALYIVRSHRSGLITTDPRHPEGSVAVSLDVRDYDIFTAYPTTQYDSETNGSVYIANLGLIEKMTGAAAITASQSELLHTGKVFLDTRLKALGVLGVYISSLPDMSISRDFMVTILGEPIPPHTVTVSTLDSHVLNIDVEKAWKEMGLEAGWANEVEVKVYFDIEYP